MPKYYISTYLAVCGWKAIEYGPEGPEQTGVCGYDTEEDAIIEAKEWAEDMCLPYVPRVEARSKKHMCKLYSVSRVFTARDGRYWRITYRGPNRQGVIKEVSFVNRNNTKP